MSIFTGTTEYSILDLGFDKLLVKLSSVQDIADVSPELTNVFTSGVAPKSLTGGEFIEGVNMVSGFLQSSNFESGSAGWQLTPTSAELNISTALASLDIPDTTTANSFHVDSDGNMWQGATTYAAAPAQYANTGDITITGTLTASDAVITGAITISSGSGIANLSDAGALATEDSVTATLANIALQGWTQTCAFSVTDTDTVAWGAGTLTTANGTNYSIGAANTGNMAARTYIYLDIAVSITAYQTTTTAATAVGNGKILVATAINGTTEARFQVFGGTGGLHADASDLLVANTVVAGLMSVSQLSAISADLGVATAGSISVVNGANTIGLTPSGTNAIFSGTTGSPEFKVTPAGALTASGATITEGTITGGTIQTAASGQRITLVSNTLVAYNSGGSAIFDILSSAGQQITIQARTTQIGAMFFGATGTQTADIVVIQNANSSDATAGRSFNVSKNVGTQEMCLFSNNAGTGETAVFQQHALAGKEAVRIWQADLDKTGLFIKDNGGTGVSNKGLLEVNQANASSALTSCLDIYGNNIVALQVGGNGALDGTAHGGTASGRIKVKKFGDPTTYYVYIYSD